MRTTVTALVATGVMATAQAAPLSVSEAEARLVSATTLGQAKAAHRSLQAALAAQTSGADIIAPVLQSFSITGVINVQKVGAWAQVDAKVKDNLSGVRSVNVGLRSPSGKRFASVYMSATLPETKSTFSTTVGGDGGMSSAFGAWSEAGDWLVDYVQVTDAAGNGIWVPGSALTANGWSDRVTVLNAKQDQQPPTLTSGVLGAAQASLADNAPGTVQPGYVSATLTLKDLGDGGVSGISSASLKLCRVNADQWCMSYAQSIYLGGSSYVRGKGSLSLKVAGQLRRASAMDPGNEVGDYRIVEVNLIDYAGNSTNLRSVEVGGTTDFKTLFPNTIFTLNP